jgi:nanoRNase/pAp phosphatase (c-di-AMP/oligoRNAs hydrolase)
VAGRSNDLAAAIRKYKNIMIVVKGSPDPDAIASSFALGAVCQHLGTASSIILTKELSLPENKAFVNILKIPISFAQPDKDKDKFDAYIIADYQSPIIPAVTGSLPCAVYIDHHESSDEEIKADFILIDTEAGATSSLMALLIKDLSSPLDDSVLTPVATALLYGIYTDTDKYSHASTIDYEALGYISKFADNAMFHKISSIPLSKITLQMLNSAIGNKLIYKDWLITGIGFIDSSHRDSIAIVADFLLKREKFSTVVVFAVVENSEQKSLFLDASFRSNSERTNLNDIIKKITPQGGARKYKGAYQIDLSYFWQCPDRNMLWNVIQITTIELLKKRRDDIYITELKGFYQRLRDRMQNYFNS